MKIRVRSIIQIVISLGLILSCVVYGLYINEVIDFRIFSIGDLNPYGGWTAVKSTFMDLSYRWKGFSRSMALSAGLGFAALFMGRFFCGYICPLGGLQDFFKYAANKMGIKEIKFPTKAEGLKYIILLFLMVLSIFNKGNLVSPYSPWLAYLNIFTAFKFQRGTLILVLIIVISLFGRRIFCRYFCPLGAFQSLLYALGPLKIKKGDCDCSSCLRACPVGEEDRISPESKDLSPECVNCLKCVKACLRGREGFSLSFAGKSLSKKTYIIISLSLLLGSFILLPLTRGNSSVEAWDKVENVRDGLYEGSGIGFGGLMKVEVTIKNKKITDIKVLNHRETQGYYEEVFRDLKFEVTKTQNINPDGVSGATSTSRGFISSIKDGVSKSLDME